GHAGAKAHLEGVDVMRRVRHFGTDGRNELAGRFDGGRVWQRGNEARTADLVFNACGRGGNAVGGHRSTIYKLRYIPPGPPRSRGANHVLYTLYPSAAKNASARSSSSAIRSGPMSLLCK